MRHPVVIAATALLGLVVSATVAFAEVTDRWVAVDAVASSFGNAGGAGQPKLVLTGVREGAGSPDTYGYELNSSSGGPVELHKRCERLALLAMSRPGRYALEIVRYDTVTADGNYVIRSCRLVRND